MGKSASLRCEHCKITVFEQLNQKFENVFVFSSEIL